MEGCDRPTASRGWCAAHYGRWLNGGDVRAEKPLRPKKAKGARGKCSVESCTRAAVCKGMCAAHHRRWSRGDVRAGDVLPEPKTAEPCAVETCEQGATAAKGLCPAHYQRLLNHNDVREDTPVGAHLSPGEPRLGGAYMRVQDPDHPLSYVNGEVYVHRKVLFDAIGDGEHLCHWCETPVRWQRPGEEEVLTPIHVDHLDGDRMNNERDNLAPACQPCNFRRGVEGNSLDWVPLSKR